MFTRVLARLRGHVGFQRLLRACLRHPYYAVALLLGAFYFAYGWVTPKVQSQSMTAKPVPDRQTELQRQQQARAALREQQQEASAFRQLQTTVEQQGKEVKTVTAALTKTEATVKQLQDERAELAKQLVREREKHTALARQHQERPRHERPATPVVTTPRSTTSEVSTAPKAELRVLHSNHKDSFVPPPPNRGDVAYIGPGCYVEIALGTGVMVTTRAGGKQDVMIALKKEAYCPQQLMGPGRPSRVTALPVQGCLALGEAVGDLASGRVQGKMETLACVMTDGSFYEPPIEAYLVDIDLTNGIVGEVHHHAGAAELKAWLAALAQEGSAMLGLARSKLVVTTNNSSGVQPFAGVESGLNKMTDLYIEQMQFLLPTLWAPSNSRGYMVFKKGVSLPGLPTSILMTRGQ